MNDFSSLQDYQDTAMSFEPVSPVSGSRGDADVCNMVLHHVLPSVDISFSTGLSKPDRMELDLPRNIHTVINQKPQDRCPDAVIGETTSRGLYFTDTKLHTGAANTPSRSETSHDDMRCHAVPQPAASHGVVRCHKPQESSLMCALTSH
jgi:hypothetical protein